VDSGYVALDTLSAPLTELCLNGNRQGFLDRDTVAWVARRTLLRCLELTSWEAWSKKEVTALGFLPLRELRLDTGDRLLLAIASPGSLQALESVTLNARPLRDESEPPWGFGTRPGRWRTCCWASPTSGWPRAASSWPCSLWG